MIKPKITRINLFESITGEKTENDMDMYEVCCGNCGQVLFLYSENPADDRNEQDTYRYCFKCGAGIDWTK